MDDFTITGPFPPRRAYLALRDLLIARLLEAGASAGAPFCSDAQLMELTGLSRTTVRKAVDELCQAGWVERRAGVGTFVGPRAELPPHPARRQAEPAGPRFASRDNVRVAVLLHLQDEGGVDYFTRGVLQGLESAAPEEALSVELVGDSNMDVHALVKRLCRTRAEVLVVMPCTTRHAMLAGVAESRGVRCLLAGSHLHDSGLPTVCEDGGQGAGLAVSHLYEKGHRRIGLWLSQTPAIWVHQRRNGFLKALRECGLGEDERTVLWTPCSPVADVGCRSHLANVGLFEAYLREQRPTALVIGSSGQHTRTLGEWIRRRRAKVPGDLSVVFLDQYYEDYARYLRRRPTVVALPLAEMGRALARLAGQAGRGAEVPDGELALPCSLVEGDSVGPPAADAARLILLTREAAGPAARP